MAEQKLDVYRDWLKISATNRPLNYYQILKLKPFEDDAAVIRDHYRKLNAYIRKFATGDYIDESQELLNELAKAMLCLTDLERKSDYDARLGRKSETPQEETSRSFDDILLRNRILTPENLKKAKNYANAVGLDLQMAILQQRLAPAEQVMLAFAESEGLPFINLDEVPVDEYYAPQIDPNMARSYSFVPVMADMGRLILASPAPISLDVEEQLRVLFDMPIRSAICTPAQVNAAIAKYYPRDAVQRIVQKAKPAKEKKGKKKEENEEAAEVVRVVKKQRAQTELSAQAKKNRILITVMAFNFALVGGGMIGYFTHKFPQITDMILPGVVAAVIGASVGWVIGTKVGAKADEEE